ncbi:MAG: hypothetical protein V4699_00125 [Patescibacteria group bacterium]
MRAYNNGQCVEVGTILHPNIHKAGFEPTHFSDIVFWHTDETPKRCLGQYKLGTASAELKLQSGGGPNYWLQITFTDLKDGQSLYGLIMSGRIAPFLSYEEEQHVTAIRHFADLWREFWMLLRTSFSNRMHRLRNT